MKNFLFTVLCIVGFVYDINAQMQTWTWNEYKVKFKAPQDFETYVSNGSKFSAGNRTMTLTIHPRRGENLRYSAMERALVSWARKSDVSITSDPGYVEDLNGYWGVMLSGVRSGSAVLLTLLIDPDYPHISMYVWLSFGDYDMNRAYTIMDSFEPK